jgi:DNA helicase TIP49 (TBP-interacting protein)
MTHPAHPHEEDPLAHIGDPVNVNYATGEVTKLGHTDTRSGTRDAKGELQRPVPDTGQND